MASRGPTGINELADFLTARGYLRVPLFRSGVGHFHTAGTLNGRAVEVLVDSGASCTVVALSVVRELGLRSDRLDGGAGGAGGPLDQYLVHGADLRLSGFAPRVGRPVGLDFTQINPPLLAQGSAAVDVILGADAFDAHAAVLDYPSQSLFLRAVEAEPGAAPDKAT